MKHCDKCDIDVESNLKNCPLCGSFIKNDDGVKSPNKHAYKEVNDVERSKRILLKIMIFASIIAGVVCMIVDIAVHDTVTWSLHLVIALLGTWLVIGKPIFQHTPIRVQIEWDMFVAILVIFYAYFASKSENHWAFHLGLPIVMMSTLGIYALIMIIDHKRWTMYAMTVTPIAILAMIPIFISLGVFKMVRWSWYVTTGIAVIMLVSFFIFGKSAYFAELKKRLHF